MKRQHGFTLTEMMVVTAIVAILLGIGVPSYRYITNSYRMSAEINSLLGDLQFARVEALRTGLPVVVCASLTLKACAVTTNWEKGWIVFADSNGNGAVDVGEPILRVQTAFQGATPDTLRPTANPAATIAAISYNREGFATTVTGFPNVVFKLNEKTSSAVWMRCLWVNTIGTALTDTAVANATGKCS